LAPARVCAHLANGFAGVTLDGVADMSSDPPGHDGDRTANYGRRLEMEYSLNIRGKNALVTRGFPDYRGKVRHLAMCPGMRSARIHFPQEHAYPARERVRGSVPSLRGRPRGTAGIW
jgi:hypothetical protein